MAAAPGRGSRVAEPPGYHDQKADHLSRLHKIEGQIRGVTRMVDEDRYCIDVVTQIGAVTRALHEVALGLLDEHARNCLLTAARSEPDEAEAKLDELSLAMRRLTRM
ncbi:metal-sensitive transcriptional regulator [Streptomyces sp. CdTB01]|uniref:metal-sensitive transcriptional regulator n=1 Tax=Streptomyces sp. CdTB01 TaxID=1725411 RepID=UPI00073A58D2|nr:metal-sensitive transcriptional regulator [Streptomyces sp. CdTB01]ALV33154.1 hypothetical protein AS200_14720 [Streptomyces sp. CdTB01]